MVNRLELHTKLESILGSKNVYFQPPESIKINYPAIIYSLDNLENIHADDGAYLLYKRYSVTIIDKNPDSKIVEQVAKIKTCRFNRYYTSENLNHWNFSLYLLTKEDFTYV